MAAFEIDRAFETPANEDVLSLLRTHPLSAHSDVAEELIRSAHDLPGVRHYSPDPERYAFVVLYLADYTITGLAYGQSKLAYRLPEHERARSRDEKTAPAPEIGPGWVYCEPWSDDETLAESRLRLARCCAAAARGRGT